MEYGLAYKTTIVILVIVLIFVAVMVVKNIPVTLDTNSADLIIVGAGTAGCILARNMSQKYPKKKVIVLDRGVNRRGDPNVYNIKNMVVAGFTLPYSETLPTDFSPTITAAVSKMIGGGSSHNFALAVRGSPDFYEREWQPQLNLSYKDLLKYFARIESYHPEFSSDRKPSPLRFTSGPIQITPLPTSLNLAPRILPMIGKIFTDGPGILGKAYVVVTDSGPLRASDSFTLNAMKIMGVPIVEDYNTDVITCVAASPQLFVDSVVGIRQSTDVKYLPSSFIRIDSESRGRNENLQLVPNATVTQVTENNVIWTDVDNKTQITKLNSGGKIIMCAGGIYTPYLLLKSGYTMNGIGQGLKSHYGFNIIFAVEATNDEDFNFSSGPVAFLSRDGTNTRDWQIVIEGGGAQPLIDSVGGVPNRTSETKLFNIILWNLKPQTTGSIEYNPSSSKPVINLRLFEDGGGNDLSTLIDGLNWINNSFTPALKNTYPSLRIVYPPQQVLQTGDPAELETYIKAGLSLTDYYCATCSLGKVVNPQTFGLYGSDTIHCVDASVFPGISDGNTNYPVMVMAEIASDRIVL
jgi:choline dehydrogenase-like flavoprotein